MTISKIGATGIMSPLGQQRGMHESTVYSADHHKSPNTLPSTCYGSSHDIFGETGDIDMMFAGVLS